MDLNRITIVFLFVNQFVKELHQSELNFSVCMFPESSVAFLLVLEHAVARLSLVVMEVLSLSLISSCICSFVCARSPE